MAKIKLSKKKLIILISISVAVIIILAGLITAGIIIGNKNKKISINSLPNTLEYNIGDEADYSGLKIQVTKRNGKFFFVDYTDKDVEISGFDSSKAGQIEITVKYKEFTTAFNITIKKAEISKTLTNITMDTLPKTEYKIGETLSVNGGVILCTYSDGSTSREELLFKYIDTASSNFDFSTPGTYNVVVKFNDGKGIIKSTQYQITIEDEITKILTNISIETLPKTDYKVGESLEVTGGVILCTYNDGSTYREELLFKYIDTTSSNYDFSIPGTYNVVVKFNDGKGVFRSTQYQITVSE